MRHVLQQLELHLPLPEREEAPSQPSSATFECEVDFELPSVDPDEFVVS